MAIADHLQVFISSVMTDEDLGAERAGAAESISSLQLTRPWSFEYAPAEPNNATTVYLREVGQSDLVVCIVSNSHTPAVQAELNEAVAKDRPILAFVRKLSPNELPNDGRTEVVAWLRDRVKYREYSDVEDLKGHVKDAISAELVRGYRKYRVDSADLSLLFNAASVPPSVSVGAADPGDRDAIRRTLMELKTWYPEIETWIDKVTAEVGQPEQTRIAKIAGEIAGIAVAREKGLGVRKLSTLYVRPGFRGEAVGPRLVYQEVQRAAGDGVRKAYVTFAGELYENLFPILRRYGFRVEGVSAGRYRPGSAEWVMAKTFVYGTITAKSFSDFVHSHLVSERGGQLRSLESDHSVVTLPNSPLFGFPAADDMRLFISTSATPEEDYERIEEKASDASWLLVSLYGKPADASHWSHQRENWVDGEDLSAQLYPVRFERSEEPSLLVVIKPTYADALIPDSRRPQLFAQEKLQIRPDNSYYRSPDRYRTLRRGSKIFFYVSSPEMTLRGSARLRDLSVGEPADLVAAYGSMGILKFEDIQGIASKHNGKALAIAFDWYVEHPRRVPLAELKSALTFNPIGAKLMSNGEATALLGASQVE